MTDPTPRVLPEWTPPPTAYGPPQPQRRTNGLAIASLVTSLVALLGICGYGVGGLLVGPVGAVLGHVARRQIRERQEEGDGMAQAGMIIGWIATGIGLLIAAFAAVMIFWLVRYSSQYGELGESPY